MRSLAIAGTAYPEAEGVAAPYSRSAVVVLLCASTVYLGLMAAINAHVMRASPALIGIVEAAIYAACLAMLAKALTPRLVTGWVLVVASLALLWLIRQQIDVKGLRDLVIPLLFVALGRHVADSDLADSILTMLLVILIAVGLFEAFALDAYIAVFNTFSFYVNLGSINESAAMFEGQGLTLNGFRPEGIGRTLLPWLLGSHRVSSLLLDPVSLGNFAVITFAWALSKGPDETRMRGLLMGGALVLIVLADSRFGALVLLLMALLRCIPAPILERAVVVAPLACVAVTCVVATFAPVYGDNLAGRLTSSGQVLMELSPRDLLGVGGLPAFGDMGYAYVVSRFGLPLLLVLYGVLVLSGNLSKQGTYFRAFALLYAALILMVSGTSLFALKTAALLWFLFGVATSKPLGSGSGYRR